ncbi:MAG TPA: hypothetical protein VFW33_24125 [Gemmataceae bacterium]|nr:hypothetical protein [Gemmataceae bacterium]
MNGTGNRVWWWRGAAVVLLTCGVAAGLSCGTFPASVADARGFPFGGSGVQEGEVTLRDGDEAAVTYPRAYQEPPRLVIVEFRQSWFKDKPYSKSDFQFVRPTATGFRVVNNHPEPGRGSTATFKWRAEGVIAAVQPPPPALIPGKATPEQVVAAVKALGGTATTDPANPSHPVIAIDLHHQRVGDAQLDVLRAAPALRSLNLAGTHVTDEGMKVVGGLTKLQTLQLNDTSVGDAGLAPLKGLTELRELGLYHTRVTDDGLPYLQGLAGLRDLTLGGTRITGRGVGELRALHDLRHLVLAGTGVSKAEVQELKKAMPKTDIIQ